MTLLVINAGSSSHKLALFEIEQNSIKKSIWKGRLEWDHDKQEALLFTQNDKEQKIEKKLNSNEQPLKQLVEAMWIGESAVIKSPSDIYAIGHRIVHGGNLFQKPTKVTHEVKELIRKLIPLAPLHQPAGVEGIELMQEFFPNILQYAVFDTAFHRHMPEYNQTYAIPYRWKELGIQRYGFHGISHQYCAERIAQLMNKDLNSLRLISCHLGNGSSLCAMRNGISLDTTMGFTPLEGLMMGTRSGSIDPAILLYILSKGISGEELERQLNFESGLKGISGTSDMRELLQKQREPKSQLALKMYIQKLKGYIGFLITELEGMDALIFTGGIGENSWEVRELACERMGFLGVYLDRELNKKCEKDQKISSSHSKVDIFVIKTQEEWMIAKLILELEKQVDKIL